ncbi:magnesium-chelatase subunit ChlD, chloroplastic-like [Spinacia oleracea]|uniref:Magnesium-chelatase subunit ChlD, chloroplastic-like n=1 Tax=Spinacia oleracea TaxID=3562 RepID=A0ABM3QYT2_SPIOL|nr:magnesium-chelatase subunit ChlD, chloroplastic-like [Spinacia oleracea]
MEDRLIGSIDIEKSVKSGTTVFQPGYLAEAHRGVLYIDEISLLDEGISNLLLNVLTEGVNVVEREGISFRHPCKPLLIATYNLEEGAVREYLLDRVAINLSADLPMSFDDRVAAVGIATQFQEQTNEVFKMVEEETKLAKTQVQVVKRCSFSSKCCEIPEHPVVKVVGNYQSRSKFWIHNYKEYAVGELCKLYTAV